MRNSVNLRVLADIVKNHMGDVLGRTIYPERPTNGPIREPYTMDNDLRPEIIAILTCMLESEDVGAGPMYPRAKSMAEEIIERKAQTDRSGVVDHAKFMAQSIELNLLGWHRQIKMTAASNISSDHTRSAALTKSTTSSVGRVTLPWRVRHSVLIFAETIVRAVQIYDETLVRNCVLWDDDAPEYVAADEFNWAFDMSYIELAIVDLGRD